VISRKFENSKEAKRFLDLLTHAR